MQRDPKGNDSSLRGNEAQRRAREVHKVRLGDLAGLSDQDVSAMVASGDIELMVRRSEIEDASNGGWSHRLADLFDKVAGGLNGAPAHENRTIIVNFVAGGAGLPHR
jgi:hypothetical protein